MSHFASPDATAGKDYWRLGIRFLLGYYPLVSPCRAAISIAMKSTRVQRIASVTDAAISVILSKWIAHKLLTFQRTGALYVLNRQSSRRPDGRLRMGGTSA